MLDSAAMNLYSFNRQCVGIGDEGKISSVFLPSGNGAHTPGRIEQILPFCFSGDRTPSGQQGPLPGRVEQTGRLQKVPVRR